MRETAWRVRRRDAHKKKNVLSTGTPEARAQMCKVVALVVVKLNAARQSINALPL